MNIKRIVTKDVKKLSDLKKIDEFNKNTINELYNAAEEDYKQVWGRDKDYIRDFISGRQWSDNMADKPQGLAFRGGRPVYYENIVNTFNYDLSQNAARPKYVVNLTKSYCETLIAKFCEIDPICRAKSRSDYFYDTELLRKIDLLAWKLFYQENSFKDLYQKLLSESLYFRQSYVWIKWDQKKANTDIPVKWEFLESDALRIDPNATDINFAEYIVHNVKMKYGDLKYKYNYQKDSDDKRIIDFKDIVEVRHWWFRIKLEGKYKWIMMPEYENKYLKILDEDGEPLDVEAYDYLPFVIFKGKPTKYWYGDHFALDIIPFNMMYNLIVTMENWNMRKVIDKPWMGTGINVEAVKSGDQPGGYINVPNQAQLRGAENVVLVGSTEFQTIKQQIKEEISDIIGNMGILSGQTQPRVYSGKMLEETKSLAELKPQLMESAYHDSISEMFEKSMLCILHEGKTVSVFDPDFDNQDGTHGANVEIEEKDILNNKYEIHVEVDDAKLLSKKDRFNALVQLMQYSNLAQIIKPSLILKSANGQMPGLIPDSLIKQLEESEQPQPPINNRGQGGQGGVSNPSNPSISPKQGGGGNIPPVSNKIDEDNIPLALFDMEVNRYVQEMKDAGVTSKVIADTMDTAGLTIGADGQTMVPKPDPDTGKPMDKADILNGLEVLANKQIDIFGRK